jgi:hypothetical protein
MLAVMANNRAVYSALKRVPALCDKEERLRRDPKLAKGDQAPSARHKTCHLSAPSLGSGARAHRGVRARSGGKGGLKVVVAPAGTGGQAATGTLREDNEREQDSCKIAELE